MQIRISSLDGERVLKDTIKYLKKFKQEIDNDFLNDRFKLKKIQDFRYNTKTGKIHFNGDVISEYCKLRDIPFYTEEEKHQIFLDEMMGSFASVVNNINW